jgi:hypothetical protein
LRARVRVSAHARARGTGGFLIAVGKKRAQRPTARAKQKKGGVASLRACPATKRDPRPRRRGGEGVVGVWVKTKALALHSSKGREGVGRGGNEGMVVGVERRKMRGRGPFLSHACHSAALPTTRASALVRARAAERQREDRESRSCLGEGTCGVHKGGVVWCVAAKLWRVAPPKARPKGPRDLRFCGAGVALGWQPR